jgi:HEAT repeat protein
LGVNSTMKLSQSQFLRRSLSALLWALACGACAPATVRAQAVPLVEQCGALAENQGEEFSRALAALGGKGAQDTRGAQARVAAAKKLADGCEKRAVAPLVALLADEDAPVRAAAVEALGKLGDRSAIDALLGLTSDPDWRVRLALGRALCAFQQARASYAALNFILGQGEPQDADDMRARAAAAVAIHQLRDVSYSRKALTILLSFADRPSEEVRKAALEALASLKDTRNGPAEFVGLLKQSINPMQRRKAAYWIGELRIERGRDLLAAVAANDSDAEVRKIAAAALAKLGKAPAE